MKKGTAFHESETHPKYASDLKTFDENRGIVFHKLKIHPKNARGLKTSNEKRGTAFHKLEMQAAQSPPPSSTKEASRYTTQEHTQNIIARVDPITKRVCLAFPKNFRRKVFSRCNKQKCGASLSINQMHKN
jgi:hypothetical protein